MGLPFCLFPMLMGLLQVNAQHAVGHYPPAPTNHYPSESVYGTPVTLVYKEPQQSQQYHPSDYDEECVRKMENYKKARRILGHRELEESHYMAPDQALLNLAGDEEYEYSETNVGNRRSSVRFGRNLNDLDVGNSTDFEYDNNVDSYGDEQITSKSYNSQPKTHLPIKVDYYCDGDRLYWTESNPSNGKVLKYERQYNDDKGTMAYKVSADNLILNHVFNSKPKKKGLAAAIAIPIAVGVPLGLLAIPFALGVVAFVVVSGGALAAVLGTLFMGLAGLFRNKERFKCHHRRILFPCACSETIDAQGKCFLTITCPQGVTLQEMWEVFHRIPVRNNIETIVLNLPAGANSIPADFLGNNRAKVLQLIGPAGTIQQNILTINNAAFSVTSATTTLMIFRQFNFVNINWNCLTGFNVLTTVQIFNSININLPPILPSLPFLNQFLIDGVNNFPSSEQFQCPSVNLLLPCTCLQTLSAQGQFVLAINCPQGTALADIQTAFNRIPVRINIDTIVLNLPAGTNDIPASFLGNNKARVLELIGPTASVQQNILTANTASFQATATKTTLITIRQFNLININWNFLIGFNVLTTVQISNCVNVNVPPVLPALPNLNQFLVDGVNKLPANGRASRFIQRKALMKLVKG